MKMNELPLKLMHTVLSDPRQSLLDRLDDLQITTYLRKKYQSPEDLADSFDGAFTATQIEIHLVHGSEREEWHNEVLGWYDYYHKNINGPFYDGLETTLTAMGLEDFYKESIDFIIDRKGKL
ncbi:MAG: hypothetical protein NTW67_05540 [Candidatus Woesearchaeota archaeon]|nr:hypothetical protein [Candidatus Woesearchaeota archaeon]